MRARRSGTALGDAMRPVPGRACTPGSGRPSRRACAKTGAWNRSPGATRWRPAMNVSTSPVLAIGSAEEPCGRTCAVARADLAIAAARRANGHALAGAVFINVLR